jgi:hypothetical protein
LQEKDPNESYVNVNFTMLNYPFLLDTLTKSEVMQIDCNMKMKGEIDRELLNLNIFANNQNQDFVYLNIEVRRE